MEINTKIIDIKNRVGKNSNKIYWSIETSDGNFNCHEESVIKEIKPFINGMCNLLIRETPKADGNGIWQNVIGIAKEIRSGKVNVESQKRFDEAKEMSIEDKYFKDQPAFKNDNKFTTMYVSYAKDIFIALIEADKGWNEKPDIAMAQSIDLVKQARDAFS